MALAMTNPPKSTRITSLLSAACVDEVNVEAMPNAVAQIIRERRNLYFLNIFIYSLRVKFIVASLRGFSPFHKGRAVHRSST
jgi:hypothetical protein